MATMRLAFIAILLMGILCASGQVPPENVAALQKFEKELADLSNQIVNDSTQDLRAAACFKFIPKLVEALKVKGSFDYPFDSVDVSILKPTDNAFRMFTWQLRWGNGLFRQ